MNKILLASVCLGLLPILTTCGGGGSSSGKPQMTMMPSPEETAPETPAPVTTTPPLFIPGTFQTSHELQASAIGTEWPKFHNDPGSGVAYGDFDGDGDEDFFIAAPDRVDDPVSPYGTTPIATPVEIWENDGNNIFSLNTTKFFVGAVPEIWGARKILTGDYNGDNKLDIVALSSGRTSPHFNDATVALFLSSENGLTYDEDSIDFVGYHHGAASGDIDNDGDLDIFVADTANDPVFFINDGAGDFTRNMSLVPSEINDLGVYTSELVDVDGDSYLDLLVAGHDYGQNAAPTTIYWGDGTGDYINSLKTILPRVSDHSVVVDIDVGDLDGDGNNDVVLNRTAQEPFYQGFYVQIVSGSGNRQFADTTSQSIDFGAKDVDKWVMWLRLIDVDDNGSLDIAVDGNFARPGTIWLNDGSGNLELLRERPRPYLRDWMKIANGLNDAQVRQGMNAVVRGSDSSVHVSASASESATTFNAANPAISTVGSVDFGNVSYQEIAGFHSPRIPLALGYREQGGDSYLGFGAWLDHSAFGVTGSVDIDGAIESNAYSLGGASGTNPVSGSATWSGAVVGIDGHSLGRGQLVRGKSEVTLDFADSTVDILFSGMGFLARGHSWIHDMIWNDVPLNAGVFGTGADNDFIRGQFYGSGHEEVGGVFMRDYVVGAFGGKREE